jgi:hypothetical protein
MVELFATYFHRMPRFVETPVLRVATQQLPTLATLHRPPLADSGPVDGIFTRFAYDSLHRKNAEGLSESPSFQNAWDRMPGLLVHVGASAIQMQHAPASGLLWQASLEPDEPFSWYPALRAGSVKRSNSFPLSVVGKATFTRRYLLSKKSRMQGVA